MQTYVINTSENKNFNSNLLFDLANYSQIKWMWCSLPDIERCAEAIYQEEIIPIPSRDFRVVVLVDFFGYRFASRTNQAAHLSAAARSAAGVSAEMPENSDAPGEYVAIYKNFIGQYLLQHLFDFLRKSGIPAKECDVYFMQYHNEQASTINQKHMEQTANLFGLNPETNIPQNAALAKLDGGDPSQQTLERHNEFVLHCNKDVKLPFPLPPGKTKSEQGATFDAFYRHYINDRSKILDEYHVRIHPPYVALRETEKAAAFDSLSLSLYLIYLYERQDVVVGDPKILKPDPNKLKDLIRNACLNVHQARVSIQKSCMYYRLEVPDNIDEALKSYEEQSANEITEETVRDPQNRTEATKNLSISENVDELYQGIVRFAEMDDNLQNDINRAEMDRLMGSYLACRDEMRDDSENLDLRKDCAQTENYPDPMTLKNAKKEKRKKLQRLLALTLDADYVSTDYSKKKQEAEEVRDNYHRLKARMRGKLLADLCFFIVAMGLMAGSYALLQLVGVNAFWSAITLVLSVGVFAAIYVAAFLIRILPIAHMIKAERMKMQRLFVDCHVMHYLSFRKLTRRYQTYLPSIESVRYSLRVLDRLNQENKTKNINVERHQKMLENMEETLVGMHNSLTNSDLSFRSVGMIDEELKIDVEKDFKSNEIYQILSIKNIEELMPKEEARD